MKKLMVGVGYADVKDAETGDAGGLQMLFDVQQAKNIASYVHEGCVCCTVVSVACKLCQSDYTACHLTQFNVQKLQWNIFKKIWVVWGRKRYLDNTYINPDCSKYLAK